MLECIRNYRAFYGLRGEFGPKGEDLSSGAEIWVLGLEFRPWDRDLGLKAMIWDLRLEFSIKAGLGSGP